MVAVYHIQTKAIRGYDSGCCPARLRKTPMRNEEDQKKKRNPFEGFRFPDDLCYIFYRCKKNVFLILEGLICFQVFLSFF